MAFDKLSMYTLVKQEKIDNIDSIGYSFIHNKSGARICLISNNDNNKVFTVGFRTPPEDNTGLPHILEHSVLCGSKHFPLKDPFVELAKGSLNTFLNAMTYPDKTLYPVASCNDKDFQNLMHVYLDAVWYPLLYTNKKILKQEGWHYELDESTGRLSVNGVVYNEMKGAYSLPEGVLERESMKLLYPDSPYSKDSGGTPGDIPSLTQKQFTDFHSKYYHPSNSYIYLYGNVDIEERLLWLDEKYLSDFNAIDIDSKIKLQKPFTSPQEAELDYPIASDESMEDNTYLCSYYAFPDECDYEKSAAWQVLEFVLLSAPGSPLRKALIEAHVGKDIIGGYEKDLRQPMFSIITKNANASQKEEFCSIVDRVLKEQVKNGIDKKALKAAISTMDFSYREADYGKYPKGLMYGLNLIGYWIYSDDVPFKALQMLDIYKSLKEKADTGYFEELIQTYILDNPHKVSITMKPNKEMSALQEKKDEDKWENYKKSLSSEELKGLAEDTAELKKYQQEEDTPEVKSCLPVLKRSDMRKEILPLNTKVLNINKVKLLMHDYQTKGIAYLDLMFNVKGIAPEYLPYISLLKNVLMFIDTDDYEYGDLFNEIQSASGGMLFNTVCFEKNNTDHDYGVYFSLSTKAVYDKLPIVFNLLKSVVTSSHLNDLKRLKEILAEQKSQLQMDIMSSGHIYAMTRSAANYYENAYVEDMFSGIGYYYFIKNITDNFEACSEELISKLKYLCGMIFNSEEMIVDYTGDADGLDYVKREVNSFIKLIDERGHDTMIKGDIKLSRLNEGFKCSSQVQYVAKTGEYICPNDKHTGALSVVSIMMKYDYLWNQLRVLGGAYGCMNGFGRNGRGYFISYRDPHLKRTLEVYDKAAEYLKNFNGGEDVLTKYIIGTLSDIDMPLSANKSGQRSQLAYLAGISEEELQKDRDEILNINTSTINMLAERIEKIVKDNHLCVIGSEEKINANSDLFDAVRTL